MEEDPELEALLARLSADPDTAFVESLERRLLGTDPAASRRQRRRRLVVALSGAAGLAGALLAVSLAGVSPLSSETRLHATPACTTTLAQGEVTTPMVVIDAEGKARIVRRNGAGRVPVRACETAPTPPRSP